MRRTLVYVAAHIFVKRVHVVSSNENRQQGPQQRRRWGGGEGGSREKYVKIKAEQRWAALFRTRSSWRNIHTYVVRDGGTWNVAKHEGCATQSRLWSKNKHETTNTMIFVLACP